MASSQMVGRLRVGLSVDQAEFRRGMAQARTGLQRFSGEMNRRLGALGDLPGVGRVQDALGSLGKNVGAALATGAAAATVALAGISTAAINAAGEIQNMSRLANAAPEEFQGWAAGARSVGIEQDKLADILKDVNDRVGDFISTGGGPMKDFFEVVAPKVGVTAEQFRKLSGPQALQLYVDTLQKANLNQQDMTFYMEAMASDSTLLLPLLRDNGKAMGDLARRAEDLGAVMDNRTVKSLAAMKATLGEVGTVMRGVRNALGAAFAPVIQAVAQSFVSLMTKGSGVRLVFDGMVAVIATVARFVADLVTVVSGAVAWLWDMGKAVAQAVDRLTGLSDAMAWLIAHSPIGWIYSLVTGFADLIRATGSFGNALSALGDLAGLVWQGIVDSAAAIPPGLSSIWQSIRRDFFYMLADLQNGWADLLKSFRAGLNSWGLNGDALTGGIISAMDAGAASNRAGASAGDAAAAAAGRAKGIVDAAFGPMRDKLAELTATADDAAASLGGGAGGLGGGVAGAADKAGGAASKATEKLSALQQMMKTLREEAAKLKATLWMSATDAAVWENLTKAGVSADSVEGREIEAVTRTIEGMKQLKAATEEWKTSLSDGFRELSRRGSSFGDVLSGLLDKLADMIWSQGFDMIWNGGGLGKAVGGALSWLGIGANANGTKNWPGGLTALHERGAEIVDLPDGSRVIPHPLSKQMVEEAAANPTGLGRLSMGFDRSVGDLTAVMYDIAGNVVGSARQSIVGASVSATGRAMATTKKFGRKF